MTVLNTPEKYKAWYDKEHYGEVYLRVGGFNYRTKIGINKHGSYIDTEADGCGGMNYVTAEDVQKVREWCDNFKPYDGDKE